MSNPSRFFLPIFLSLVVLAVAYAFYLSIEIYEETESTGWSKEARRNPYLAAQLFMRQSGLATPEANSLLTLDSLDNVGTLFISDPNQVVSPRQLERLMEWLEDGGDVIVGAGSISGTDDLLLSKFGVRVEWAHDDESDDQTEADFSLSESLREYNRQIDEGKTPEEIAELTARDDNVTLTNITFESDSAVLQLAFNEHRVLVHPYIEGDDIDDDTPLPFSWSSSDRGIHMMQFEHGSGQLTIVSDPTIWQSRRIDDYDHAFLLWMLADNGGDFATLYPRDQDSLWTLAGRHAGELLVALAVLTAAWLWFIGRRFGPVAYCETGVRRALGEHFSATAGYLWHNKSTPALLTPLRQQIIRRASLSLSGFTRAAREQQYRLIAETCQLGEQAVTEALEKQQFSEADFIRTVKLLQYIERHL